MLIAPLSRFAARPFCLLRALVLVSVCALTAAFGQSPSSLDGFNPDVDGNVYALATQPDGKVLVGGQFTTFRALSGDTVSRSNLARLNVDGTVDASFNPSANGPVRAILIQADGRILIGGDFTSLQPGASGATVARGLVARLNPNGSVDTGFNPNLGGSLLPQVYALVLQPNGQFVAGGSFTSVQANGAAQAATRNNLARFNADGSLDAGYDPKPNGIVLALAMHVQGKLVVGGGFTSLQPASDPAVITRNRIARLNANGTVDSEFNPDANNGVTSLAVQRDGKIVLGGYFTTLQPVGDASPATRQRLARLNVDGTLDSEFNPRANGSVLAVAVQPDGGLLVGGSFTSVWGRGSETLTRSYVARFSADGSLDTNFAPSVNGVVDAFGFQSDGKIVIGGYFTRAIPRDGLTAVVRNRLARLNADGSLDTDFQLEAGGRVLVSATQADGRVVIGGTFTSVGGATHNYLARLSADGTVDPTYNPSLNGRVSTLAIQSDNKVIVGGTFTSVTGEPRNFIARLNPSGSIDSEFNPIVDGPVGVILLQPDNRILVGGTFNNVIPARASASTPRSNLLRLNADGTLDTAFDPSPNAGISALALQSDSKILIGGQFNALAPGAGTTLSTAQVGRSFMARLNADGTLDTAHAVNVNARVSAIAVQSDGKAIIAGAFTAVQGTNATASSVRNRIARFNVDGTIDAAYDPNANGNVIAAALQSDGKLLIGGTFTTLQPNAAAEWTLRKYAARLNSDGTVDSTFNLDINEAPGNRVDSLRVQSNGQAYLGGNFLSLHQVTTPARITRPTFARLNANGTVDVAFDPTAGGATGAVVNGIAVQADNRIIAVGSFADLGGAKSTNIARFNSEGTPDASFSSSLVIDGPVNAVALRLNGAPVSSQLAGFAWLNANGTLRTAFAASATRLSGEIRAIAVQPNGAILLGGLFSNLSNTTGGNLVRFNPNGTLDEFFSPRLNGAVSNIVVQPDGRVLVAGLFTTINDVARNRVARIDANGSLDVTFDPNVNGSVGAMVLQSDGKIVLGGAFTTVQPNLAATATARNFLARLNADGTLDAAYNPNPNFNVNSLAIQADGKVIAGGGFSTVQPGATGDAVARNAIVRLNTDGTVDSNFNPTANSIVESILALPNGQLVIGGSFTTLQPNGGAIVTRNNLARINSDGALDAGFNPNPNGAVTTLSLQADGAVLVGGSFSGLQPNAAGPVVSRNRVARVRADGSLDVDFNPNLNGPVSALVARPDGTVLAGGNFTQLQLIGSIVVGGNFGSVGGVSARNLAILNDDGSVSTTFQPRPDGAVNALLPLPDGKLLVGGAFTSIAGAARNGLARFNADATLDTTFTASTGGNVRSLALQADGRILVGGALSGATGLIRLNANGTADASFASSVPAPITSLAVQADGRVVYVSNQSTLGRLTAGGAADPTLAIQTGDFRTLAVQADGSLILGGSGTASTTASRPALVRLRPDGTVDGSFNPAPNGAVTAVAIQSDGRLVVGGGFSRIGGATRVGIARLSASGPGTQMLGVSANRTTVLWNRGGTVGEVAAVVFEQSSNGVNWTRLGEGRRTANGSDWQLTGLSLPSSGVFYVRVRAIAPTSSGTSTALYETVREFNFANPAAAPAGQATSPLQAAAPGLGFDPVTGIAPRALQIVVPGEGTVEIIAAEAQAGASTSRLVNLSTRGRVSADTPLILGFAVSGTESRSVLVRAAGPALSQFGVSDPLGATRLQIYNAAGALVVSVNPGASSVETVQAAARTGAFPFASGSANSAALVTLAPGTYTAQVIDAQGNGGVGLAEIYDAGTGSASRLVNVSSRASTGSGSAALISGFVIAGESAERVLLRGVGPGLAQFGAPAVTDPSIALYDGAGFELGGNDNWVSSVTDIARAATRAGAFALTAGSKDAAVLASLPAGAYTVQVRSATSGSAMLEIYEVP